jgi:hypothetical protein
LVGSGALVGAAALGAAVGGTGVAAGPHALMTMLNITITLSTIHL